MKTLPLVVVGSKCADCGAEPGNYCRLPRWNGGAYPYALDIHPARWRVWEATRKAREEYYAREAER